MKKQIQWKAAILTALIFCPMIPTTLLAKNAIKEAHPVQSVPLHNSQVNINTATIEELSEALQGIGLKKAQRIIEYRENYGPFTHVDQLQEVPGIGKSLLSLNKSKVVIR